MVLSAEKVDIMVQLVCFSDSWQGPGITAIPITCLLPGCYADFWFISILYTNTLMMDWRWLGRMEYMMANSSVSWGNHRQILLTFAIKRVSIEQVVSFCRWVL